MNAKQRKTWAHREWIRIKRKLAVKSRRRHALAARIAELDARAEALIAKYERTPDK